MSRYTIDLYSKFESHTGVSAGYRPNGYLFLATNDSEMAGLDAAREIQLRCGAANVESLDHAGVARLIPEIRIDDVIGANFCPTDGLIDPPEITRGFIESARRLGARVSPGTELVSIEIGRGKVERVVTNRGSIRCDVVVNAAGPWARGVAKLAGLELPVEPLRRHLAGVDMPMPMRDSLPMVIDFGSGFHFRRDHAGSSPGALLAGWPNRDEPFAFREDVDPAFIGRILKLAENRLPGVTHATLDPARTRSGLYEMTPDHRAIIGKTPVDGFICANGFSGHGVMHAGATGRIVSEVIMDGASHSFSIEDLAFDRFERGAATSAGSML